MVSQIELYGIYYPKGLIQGDKGRIISPDSQVLSFLLNQMEQPLFGTPPIINFYE